MSARCPLAVSFFQKMRNYYQPCCDMSCLTSGCIAQAKAKDSTTLNSSCSNNLARSNVTRDSLLQADIKASQKQASGWDFDNDR